MGGEAAALVAEDVSAAEASKAAMVRADGHVGGGLGEGGEQGLEEEATSVGGIAGGATGGEFGGVGVGEEGVEVMVGLRRCRQAW